MKIHKAGKSEVVAVCDEDLIGKCFDDGKIYLDVNERFYKGEKASSEEILNACKDASTVNIVGNNSVKVFVDAGIISEENVRKIKGVSFAIIV